MDKAELKMIENLKEKTGNNLDEWKAIIDSKKINKHGEIVKFLKEVHAITHGYASTIASKVLGTDAASATNTDQFIIEQYKGKEHLKAIYDKLITEIEGFEGDFEVAPKKSLC